MILQNNFCALKQESWIVLKLFRHSFCIEDIVYLTIHNILSFQLILSSIFVIWDLHFNNNNRYIKIHIL